MKPTYIVIHHTLVPWSKNPKQWKATDAYHRQQWNFKSSLGFYGGYNYEVAADGEVKQFRMDGERTAAQYQKNMNDGRAISICLDGNFDARLQDGKKNDEMPTPAQRKAVADLIRLKMAQYGIKRENIWSHRDVAPKSCPGDKLPDDIATFFLGADANYPQPVANTPTLYLYRAKPTGRIYLVNGLYYPIANQQTFDLLFGSFGSARWADGDVPPADKVGKILSLT